MKATGTKVKLPFLAVFFVSSFPAIFLYCQNADEAGFSEIVPVILLFSGIDAALFLIFSISTKSIEKSSIITSFFMLIITNFSFVENIIRNMFPKLKYWHIIPIVIILGLNTACFFSKYLTKNIANDFSKVICLVFGSLILFNFMFNIPKIISYVQAQQLLKKTEVIQNQDQINQGSDLPNIYLLIFDEYANFSQIEKYYFYKNNDLEDFLIQNNFLISYNSHNESILTQTVVTNLLNIDYLVDDYTFSSEAEVLRKKGNIFKLMKEHGYKVNVLEMEDFLGGHLPSFEKKRKMASTINNESLMDLCIKRSVFYPFMKSSSSKRLDKLFFMEKYLSDYKNIPLDSTFTLAYFAFPHQPFLVDENGNRISKSQSANWENNQVYLGQYKYATKIMISILDNIIENDSNCIIFLQSDHGARKAQFPIEVKSNPLNAVYYYGEKNLDIEGYSTLNTIRLVLSYLWEEDYPILPVPSTK